MYYTNSSKTVLCGVHVDKTNVIIPNTVIEIRNNAFRECTGLTSVTIPNSVTSLAAELFRGCTGLTSVTIPNSVTSIGEFTFYDCTGLTSVTIPNSVTSLDGAFAGCTGLTSVTIPNSVTTIMDRDFAYCTGLTSVTIPNSVTSLGEGAFYGCTGLTSVTIPNSVTSVGENAFYGCTGLTSVTIPNSVTSVGEYAFYGCTGLTSVTIPNSITTIGDAVFSGCTGLTSVTIPNSVTSIGFGAFSMCIGLDSLTIPNTVATIGQYAFYNVRMINYSGNAEGVPWSALWMNGYAEDSLYYTSEEKIVLIGASPFIKTADIPSTVSTIDEWAFYNCNNLERVVFHTDNPPDRASSSFAYVNNDITMQVPCGSVDNYRCAPLWIQFHNIEETVPYILTVNTVSDTTEGSVEIIQAATCNNFTAVVLATANEGYHFTMWSDSVTDNPRSLILICDTVLTALFERNEGEGIEIVEGRGVSAYPNPTRGVLYIEGEEVVRVDVYDLGGHLVMSGENVSKIDLSALPAKLYYVRVVHKHGITISKVVKQ